MEVRERERAKKARGRQFIAGLVASSLVAFAGGTVSRPSSAQVVQPVRPGAPALAPSALLAPHKANYRFSLTAIDPSTGIARIDGGLYVERDRTCLGVVETQQLLWTRTVYADGRVREERTATALEEDGRTGALTFETRRTLDARTEEVPGRPQLNFGTKLPDDVRVDTFTGNVGFANSRNNTGGTVSFSYPPGWVMPVPSGTLYPGELTRMLLQMGASGQSERSTSLFDGTSTSALYRVVARNERSYAPGEAVPESARAALATRPSHNYQIAYFPPGVPDALPEFVTHYRLFDNRVIGAVALDYGTHALKGDLISLEMLPEPNCGGDARVATVVPPAAPRAATVVAQSPAPVQARTAPPATQPATAARTTAAAQPQPAAPALPLILVPRPATPQVAAIDVPAAPVVPPPSPLPVATPAGEQVAFVPQPVEPARRSLFNIVRVAFFQGFDAPAFDGLSEDGPREAGEMVIDNYNFCPTPGQFARECEAGEEPEAFRQALATPRGASPTQQVATPAAQPAAAPAQNRTATLAPAAASQAPASQPTAARFTTVTATATQRGTAETKTGTSGTTAAPTARTVTPTNAPVVAAAPPAATTRSTASPAAAQSTPAAKAEAATESAARPQSSTLERGAEPAAAKTEMPKADAKPTRAEGTAAPARTEVATRGERNDSRNTREAERATAARSETKVDVRDARATERDAKEAAAAEGAAKTAKAEEKETAKVEAKAEPKAKEETAKVDEKAKNEPKAADEAKPAAREERAEKVREEVKERITEVIAAVREKGKRGSS